MLKVADELKGEVITEHELFSYLKGRYLDSYTIKSSTIIYTRQSWFVKYVPAFSDRAQRRKYQSLFNEEWTLVSLPEQLGVYTMRMLRSLSGDLPDLTYKVSAKLYRSARRTDMFIRNFKANDIFTGPTCNFRNSSDGKDTENLLNNDRRNRGLRIL